MIKENPQPKRLSIEVSENFLIDLKKRALNRNMTLKSYIMAILSEQILKEKQYE